MTDPTLPEELRARLAAAGRQVHRTLGPDDDSRALALEVRAAGLCAQICPVAEGPDAEATGWRHDICVLAPDHLDRHRSALWTRWGLDWHEMRDRALALADRVRATEERAEELEAELVGTRDALALATRDRGHWRDAHLRLRGQVEALLGSMGFAPGSYSNGWDDALGRVLDTLLPPEADRDADGRPPLGARVTVTVTGIVDPGRYDGTQAYISASRSQLDGDLWLDKPTIVITAAPTEETR
jgi:hypothetical protein